MSEPTFFDRIKSSPHPVVVDFWAPWCAPCRMIQPALEKLSQQYEGQVELWKINADEQPEVLRALNIYGIPTLIAFTNGVEVGRRTGAASPQALAALFEAARSGSKPAIVGPDRNQRLLRLAAGGLVLAMAYFSGLSLTSALMAAAGAAILFSAVYDRCPVYKALRGWVQERLSE